jgi:Uma2 family endonuclease
MKEQLRMVNREVIAGVTEEALMRPEHEDFEVIYGQLVEIDTDMMGLLHTIVIDNVYDLIKPVVKEQGLGLVHTDGVKYVLHADENGIQLAHKPDLAFLRAGRIPADFDLYRRPFPGAPDFALEVISLRQATSDILDKVADYLKYGTDEVWVIYPLKRELHRYRRDEQAPEIYTAAQQVQSPQLFPGLLITVAELFRVEEG